MPWKTDESGNIAASNGQPVWLDSNGQEVPVDYERLLGFGKASADAKDAAERELKKAQKDFAALQGKLGDLDLDEARAALKITASLGDDEKDIRKVLGELETLRAEKAAHEAQLEESKKALAAEQSSKRKALVRSAFASSNFLKSRGIDIPVNLWEHEFGRNFDVDGAELVPFDGAPGEDGGRNGQTKLYSQKRPGELMSVDEALEFLVGRHQDRDRFLKPDGAAGSGHPTEPSGPAPGAGGYTLSAEDGKNPAKYRAAKAAAEKAGLAVPVIQQG
jgi:hypothetical protein